MFYRLGQCFCLLKISGSPGCQISKVGIPTLDISMSLILSPSGGAQPAPCQPPLGFINLMLNLPYFYVKSVYLFGGYFYKNSVFVLFLFFFAVIILFNLLSTASFYLSCARYEHKYSLIFVGCFSTPCSVNRKNNILPAARKEEYNV